MITTTIKQLNSFNNAATAYLVRNGYCENNKLTTKQDTKLSLAIKSILKQYAKLFNDLLPEIEVINITNCLENPVTKEVLKDEKGNYKYSKDGLLSRHTQMKALYEKEVTVIEQICDKNDTILPEEESYFEGFVIK